MLQKQKTSCCFANMHILLFSTSHTQQTTWSLFKHLKMTSLIPKHLFHVYRFHCIGVVNAVNSLLMSNIRLQVYSRSILYLKYICVSTNGLILGFLLLLLLEVEDFFNAKNYAIYFCFQFRFVFHRIV